MSVRIVKIPSPLNLDINVKIDLDYVPGKALDFYLDGHIPDTPGIEWVVCRNGYEIFNDHRTIEILDNDVIAICPKQGVTAAAAIASAVTGVSIASAGGFLVGLTTFTAATLAWGGVFLASMFAIGAGMSMLVSAITPDASTSGSGTSNPVYGWGQLQQTYTEGVEIPLIFGEVKTAGHTINQFTRIKTTHDDSQEYLYMLNGLCDHELDEISDFEINGQPAAYYEDCTTYSRLGTLDDALIPGFGELITQTNVGSIVSYGNPVTAQTSGECEKIEVVLSAPEGLYKIRNSKGLYEYSVNYKVEYKSASSVIWIVAQSGTWTAESQSAIKKVITIDGLDMDQYDIRVTRMQEDETSYRNHNKIALSYLQEIVDEKLTYPGLGKFGVKILATDQLSNGTPAVTCIAKRYTVQVFDDDQQLWVPKSATNPAWICYELLQYHSIPTTRIIWSEFKEWADYCDEDIGGGVKRIELNVQLFGGTAWDQLQKVAEMGHAGIVRRNTKYGVFIDKPETQASHLFTMGNIVEGTFNIQYLPKKDRAAAVEVEYNDIDREHTRQVITVCSDEYISGSKTTEKATVPMEAAITQAQAVREGVFRINCNNHLVRVVSFDAWLDAFACVVGDVFDFQHESINYRTSDIGGVVVAAGNDDGNGTPYVTLDKPVVLTVGEVYKLKVRLGDDSTVEKTVDNSKILDWEAEYSTLPLTQEWANIPTNNDIYAFGRADTYLHRYRIITADRKNENMRSIVGLEYVDAVYTNNSGLVIDEQPWEIGYAEAINVLANEFLLPSKSGVFTSQINVTWHRSISVSGYTWGIWLEDTTAGTAPKKIGEAHDNQYTITSALTLDHTYKIYVCAHNLGLMDTGSNTAMVTILGKAGAPDDIVSFVGTWNAIKRSVNFSWTGVDDADLDRYEIQEGGTWTDGEAPVYVAKNGQTTGTIFIAEGVSENRAYCIKAVDTSGNYSTNEKATSVAIDTSDCALVTPGGLSLVSNSVIASDGRNIVTLLATWNADAELSDDFHHYNVILEDMAIGKTSAYATKSREFLWEVMPNKQYGVSVQAQDVSGNTTPWCAQVLHTTAKDTTAPAVPTWPASNFAIPGFKVIGLSWDDNSEYDFSHYIVERSTAADFSSSITVLGEIKASFHADASGLDVLETYYYRLKAVDTSGNESGYSAIKSATTTQVGATDIAYNSLIANHIQVLDLTALTAKVTGILKAGKLESADGSTYLDLDNNMLVIGAGSSGYSNLTDAPGSLNDINSTEYGYVIDPADRINNHTTTIDGGKLTNYSVDTLQLKADAVKANNIDVTSLAAIKTSTGSLSVNSSIEVLDQYGKIYGGKTTYDSTAAGFYLGARGAPWPGEYIFNIGSGDDYLKVNNGDLEYTGKLGGSSAGTLVDGQTPEGSEYSFFGQSYSEAIAFNVGRTGIFRIRFSMKTFTNGHMAYAKIYKNGSPVGTERTTDTGSWVLYSQDLTFEAGDRVSIYTKNQYSTTATYLKTVQVCSSNPISTTQYV